MKTKKFQKKTEDFICEHCGFKVKGTGYTNHCPKCFYSKHVDINPGDRVSDCGGLMKVIDIELKKGQYFLLQQCLKCGHQRKNKLQEIDDMKNFAALNKKLKS